MPDATNTPSDHEFAIAALVILGTIATNPATDPALVEKINYAVENFAPQETILKAAMLVLATMAGDRL
jgi:hypothetical protein